MTDSRYRSLERVKLLRSYLPLNAGADGLYEEHQPAVDERLVFETRTLAYLRELLKSPTRVVVVLTGNAGHGKTHMCRRILETDGVNQTVMDVLEQDLVGETQWRVAGSSRPVRIVKDLSEINPPAKGAEYVREFMAQGDCHVLICANEGRLRDVVQHGDSSLGALLGALEEGIKDGRTNPSGRDDVHVVNLNNQAATAGDGGFLKHVLDFFLNHEGAWRVCGSCAAQDTCPIRANRGRLARGPAENAKHREALIELVRITEEGGYVLTYRNALVLVAYLITGGLSCADVEAKHKKHTNLESYGLLPLLFESPVSTDESDVLQFLERIRRLDPGRIALRGVDERLHEELEERGQLGAGVFGEANQQPHRRSELKKEAKQHRQRVRAARREAWFTTKAGDGPDRAQRLGLRHHHLFHDAMTAGEQEVSSQIATIRALVKGLHTLQGAIAVDSKTSLHLVDPAFGRSGSHAAVIARSLKIRNLDLWPESSWWRFKNGGTDAPVLNSVEWIDRRLVLTHERKEVLMSLDLLAFEFILDAAQGIVMRDFYSAERRRVLRSLVRHAEAKTEGSASADIRVLLEQGEGTLTIERDGTILLERAP